MTNQVALPVPGAVSIRRLGDLDGVHFLYVDIDREDPYQSFRRLPDAVTYAGRTYGKSAYDSDLGLAIYRTDRPVALAVPRRGKA